MMDVIVDLRQIGRRRTLILCQQGAVIFRHEIVLLSDHALLFSHETDENAAYEADKQHDCDE